MQFPKQLSYLLERDQALDGAVKLCVSQFEPWINHSHLPFFPEYTDHGLTHLEADLTTATALIRDEAWPVLTPGDAAVLILAVLLHDCAMHLSEDGFFALVKEPRSSQTVPGMDADKPWHILWEDFYGEASRFDGRKLKKLFGDLQPARRPPDNPSDLTKRDRLLIGEFLRRHHPRLAQEIALYGVPGPAGNKDPLILLGLTKKDMAHVAALAGIVARSHGADVRAFLPYLQKHYDIRQYKNIHPVFLMTLLRVGDYVQIDSDRAPAQILQVKALTSPVSQGEWKAHHAIRDIRTTHEDPEALFIDALPEDVGTFLRIEEWLKGIQSELDASWAVLGEVYGRYASLKDLGLILRRIRSTIDDPDDFAKKVAYIPKKAAFKAADADLLKLLIEPLYGDSPEIGIRELMQNALDAVRELKQYQKDVPSAREVHLTDQEADVMIEVNTIPGQAEVIISDRGIGMNPGIVMDYFLTAGASFRRSDAWRKQFESDEGKSMVLRAGRFGVGALAGFLLGPNLEVTTRHIEEDSGIQFTASMEGSAIELRKCVRPVGTALRIAISDETAGRLKNTSTDYMRKADGSDWDWYCLSQPKLIRKIDGKSLDQSYLCPEPETSSAEWGNIHHPQFQAINWSYISGPRLICNGIKIQSETPYRLHNGQWSEPCIQRPNLSVFDPDAALELNLERTEVIGRILPFERELIADIANDFLAYALVNGPQSFKSAIDTEDFHYPGSARSSQGQSKDWYITSTGFTYLDASLFSFSNCKSAVAVYGVKNPSCWLTPEMIDERFIVLSQSDGRIQEMDQVLRRLCELGYYTSGYNSEKWMFSEGAHLVLAGSWRKGSRLLISEGAFARAKQGGSGKVAKSIWKQTKIEWKKKSKCLVSIGDCPDSSFLFENFLEEEGVDSNAIIGEVYFSSKHEAPPSTIAKAWLAAQILFCKRAHPGNVWV